MGRGRKEWIFLPANTPSFLQVCAQIEGERRCCCLPIRRADSLPEARRPEGGSSASGTRA